MKRHALVVGRPRFAPAALLVSDRRGPSGGSGGLLVEDTTGGSAPTPITVGYLLAEDGTYLLLE